MNLIKDFIFSVFVDMVNKPKVGGVVYCSLPVGEHSGIYVGNNKIVHLNGDGVVEIVGPRRFCERLDGWNPTFSIYTSCKDDKSVGSKNVAELARSAVGSNRDYNFILDNCHQFTAGCLTGEFNNPINFLTFLKDVTEEELGADCWRIWDIDIYN